MLKGWSNSQDSCSHNGAVVPYDGRIVCGECGKPLVNVSVRQIAGYIVELAKLRSERAEMLAALEPFVKVGEKELRLGNPDTWVAMRSHWTDVRDVTNADLRVIVALHARLSADSEAGKAEGIPCLMCGAPRQHAPWSLQ